MPVVEVSTLLGPLDRAELSILCDGEPLVSSRHDHGPTATPVAPPRSSGRRPP